MENSRIHRQNLIDVLVNEIKDAREQEEQGTPRQAINRVSARWLGYAFENDSDHFVDGGGDRGIDFWFRSDAGFDIFQTKHHELPAFGLDLSSFGADVIGDLRRVKELLMGAEAPSNANKRLAILQDHFENAISTKQFGKDVEPLVVNLGLVLISTGLTEPADIEFKTFQQSLLEPVDLRGVPVLFRATLYTVDDLINERWRLDNRQWQDLTGSKRETVDLHPEKYDEALIQHGTAVFYCHAYDLVRAYQELGYQIFEPNVRCNIAKSKVNEAIRESVMHRQTREQFRLLNNGVTIACSGYSSPTKNKPAFRATHPGVVNGLQTVVAMSDAYKRLSPEDREHFKEKCFVLVRLFSETAFSDLNRLVRATNTQNPMQARNLASNNPEQILFERLFAELGWFYERKQGAWEAFDADPRRWRTLVGKSRTHFQFKQGAGRPRIRRADNEVLGQTWLSFIGFSDEAVHNKREIFGNQQWYEFVFLHSPNKHGYDLAFKMDDSRESALNHAPSPALMLVSLLAREFAREAAPTAKQNEDDAIKRLKLDVATMSREQIRQILGDDTPYVIGQILNGMSFVFSEYLGFLIYHAFGGQWMKVGGRMLANGSLRRLRDQADFDGVAQCVNSEQTAEGDVLAVAWWSFRHILEGMVSSPWFASYKVARNRSRFNHSVETRSKLFKEAVELHRFTEKAQLTRTWAIGVKPGHGLFGFLHDHLAETPSPVIRS